MVTLSNAYTAPINRPGETPVLTSNQVWQGLRRKVRHAEEFVPVIVNCKVISEERSSSGEEIVTRTVEFSKDVPRGGVPVKEVCHHYAPCRVDFQQEDGSRISNFVSAGPTGAAEDLYLTYVFEWRHPELEAGSEKTAEVVEEHRKMAKMAVESSIKSIRRLVQEGTIA